MNWQFTPNENNADFEIPFFEDATANYAPYYSSQKTLRQAKRDVEAEMGKLGAAVNSFTDGHFSVGKHSKRHGFEIRFSMGGLPGVIRVAGLPIRKPTDRKIERVQVQALLNVADWLKASVTQPVFTPGANPLILKLLDAGTGMTFEELIMQRGGLSLPAGEDVIDGELT